MVTTTDTMPPVRAAHMDSIRLLCERYRIRALFVFGSAVHGTFDPDTSNLGFLVDLGEYGDDIADRYFGLKEGLERLFGRSVDLITVRSKGYPAFLSEIEATKLPIYAAQIAMSLG